MTFLDFLKLLVPLAVVQALLGKWLLIRLEQSVKSENARELEQLRYEFRQREQAVMIADLLAEWAAHSSEKKRLNQLAWAASLWLPPDVVKELAKTLCHTPGAKDPKEILVLVRQHMKGKNDTVAATDIVHFP